MLNNYTIHEILGTILSYSLLIVAWFSIVILVTHIAVQLVTWIL